MKSIEANYRKVVMKNPCLGEYTCLGETVKAKYFSRDTISRFYSKIMPKTEYSKSSKKEHVEQLYTLSNEPLRSTAWERKIASMILKNEKMIYE